VRLLSLTLHYTKPSLSFLGPNPTIASLSLGSPRDFQMRHKNDKSAKQEKWSLQSGEQADVSSLRTGVTESNLQVI
jgi:alkylated DNA repair dioxygenase AlkB